MTVNAHTHSFTYTADGATITATCSAEDCTLSDSKATLTIVAPTLTTYNETGKSETATLDGLADFNTATGKNIAATDIKYYKFVAVDIGGNTMHRADYDDPLTSAPTDAGDYRAEITLENVKIGPDLTDKVTAGVNYTIAKADPGTPTVSMSNYKYGETPSTPSIGTYSGGGAVTYYYSTTDSASGGTKWENITATTLSADTYYMYAVIAGTDNYNSYTTATKSFTVIHTHDFGTSYALPSDGRTITATCSNTDGKCDLPEVDGKRTATLTIGMPEGGDGVAKLTVTPTGAFGTLSDVEYSNTKSNNEWTSYTTSPFTAQGFYNARIALGGQTASVTYGMNCITYAAGLENGSITGASGATVGAEVAPTITPATGYELDTLTVNAANQQTVTIDGDSFIMPESDVTVSATFKLREYSITTTAEHGTVTAKKGDATVTSANYQNSITLTATPDAGYELSGALTVTKETDGEPVTVTNNVFTMPADNVAVQSTFTAVNYSVAMTQPTTGGIISTDKSNNVHISDEITLSATPVEGYELDAYTVTKNGGGTVTVTDGKFRMPADSVTVTATFKRPPIRSRFPSRKQAARSRRIERRRKWAIPSP